MKMRGLTLVDVLVVIAMITLLMGVLMPAGAAVRQRAYRMVCRTNLSGIGKAMLSYSDDNEEQYPKAGWPDSGWSTQGELLGWSDQTGRHYGKPGSDVTMTSSLYLLIKYADVIPQQLVCRGDLGSRVFSLSDVEPGILRPEVNDITQVWDFGQKDDMKTGFVAGQYCSYSYHMPYYDPITDEPGFPVTAASNPASPLCGDRNPYLDKNAWRYLEGRSCSGDPNEDAPTWHQQDQYYYDPDKTGNSACHRREGQNILFNDGHVLFAEYPNVGLNNDNVWKNWESTNAPTRPEEWEVGPTPYCTMLNRPGMQAPMGKRDAFLVSELNKRF